MTFESVIGLEVHAQLLTRSKIFCSCSTQFGHTPNSSTCPVCLGLPGALPVLNREALAMAVKVGLALDCNINQRSIFSRKNYFYPDLPKGYQISQFQLPIAEKGQVEILIRQEDEVSAMNYYCPKSFGIIRVHLEEDAGKSVHSDGQGTHVNLNRTGVPLIEIVSEPNLRSSQEAYDYLRNLRRILLYLGVCNGNMEQGSLRCDANVSIRKLNSSSLGTKVEIKNLNSFRFLRKALDFEIKRQIRVVQLGGHIRQETRLWDQENGRTSTMRAKEEAHDYRYFPDPDLLDVNISTQWLQDLQSEIPELPGKRFSRFVEQYSLNEDEAFLVTQTRQMADYFEDAVKTYNQPKIIFNWIAGELVRQLKANDGDISDCLVRPSQLTDLIRFIEDGKISGKMGKQILERMCRTGEDPGIIISEEGLKQINDVIVLERIVDSILKENLEKVKAYESGKSGLLGFFIGQVMKQTSGQANPKRVNEVLLRKLGSV